MSGSQDGQTNICLAYIVFCSISNISYIICIIIILHQVACHSSAVVDEVWTALVVRALLPATARFDYDDDDHDDDDEYDDKMIMIIMTIKIINTFFRIPTPCRTDSYQGGRHPRTQF